MITNCDEYKSFDALTQDDLDLLRQTYARLKVEGYEPGFDWGDFLDIVTARNGEYGDHTVVPEADNEQLEEML